ncbi:helix-hairpin-helix domain-containing protein [Cyclobacteriaceae bacterium YHN15]|nr:helix-hairpin-helix domain-containing protein [Cyclobacteriaceae bacterium YHN15]
MKFYAFLFISFFLFNSSFGQILKKGEIDMELFIEELFAMQGTDENYDDQYEGLLQILLNPINLNKTSPEILKSLYILTPIQINNFFEYRRIFGDFLSIYELQAIPEFDLETIYKLLPFVVIDEDQRSKRPLIERISKEKDTYFIFRHRRIWETRRGFTAPDTLNGRISSRYLGDPNSLYGRFRIQHSKDFSLGFTLDKDPGEEFTWDRSTNRYGFNFLSYHFTVYNRGKWKAISIGDYQLQFGQGLVFGAGFSAGKGAETITTIRRSSIGVRPYTAALEYGFFRGIAATYQAGPLNLTVMASDAPRDGNIQVSATDTSEMEKEIIASLQTSGLHRTPTEISYKNRLREKNIGGNLHYQNRKQSFQLGINTLWTQFSQPFFRAKRVYNQYEFSGQYNHIHSLYFTRNFQNYFFFGEAAISGSGGKGAVLGMMSSLHPKLAFSVLWRSYDRDFHTFYGNSFSENSRTINEKGLYLGLHFKPNQKFTLTYYYDRFEFPWLRYRVYAPSTGYEWLTRLNYRPSKNTTLFIQLREESKARNISEYPGFQSPFLLDQGLKRNIVVNLDQRVDRVWSFKSRVTASSFQFGGRKTRGFAISQDFNIDKEKWRLSSRFVLFDTDDFDNRQFIYERNVLWLFSIPALSGQGLRYYFLAQYKMSPKLSFWARFGRTIYTDREIIGSGLQQIDGNRITETVFQLRYQFNR